jgi:uncharacterized protein with beta-barrel porin domain
MTTVLSRRAARAALALGFLYIAASARSQTTVTALTQINTGNAASLGAITFQNGTLQDTSGGTYSNSLTVASPSNGTIDANGNSSVWSGALSGNGALNLTDSVGGGLLSFTGANTGFAGVTTLNGTSGPNNFGGNGVTVGVGNVSAFGSGALVLNGGTLLMQTAGTVANALQLASGNDTIDADGNAAVFSGLISGSANLLTLQDSGVGGMITLSGANTYTGVTAINGVVVGVGNVSSLGLGSVALTGGTLQMQTPSTLVAPVANNIQLNGVGNVIDANGNVTTFSGTLFGSGSLTLQNSGAAAPINLTGTSYYTGPTTVESGLTIGLANSGFGTGPVSLLGANTLQIVGPAVLPNAITFTGGATIDAFGVAATGNSANFLGTIGGAGGLTIVDSVVTNAAAPGVITLSGSGSSWTGGTVIGDGTHYVTVDLGVVNGLSAASALTVAANAAFNMNGFGQTINTSVANNGTIETGAAQLNVPTYTAGAGSALGVFPTFGLPNLALTNAVNLSGETLFIEQRPASGQYTIVAAPSITDFGGPVSCPTNTTTNGSFCVPNGYIGTMTTNLADNEVILSLTAPSLVLPGQSRNESSIAGALNATNAANSPDMAAILAQVNALAFTAPAQLREALDEMSPINYSALSGLSQAGTGAQMEAVNRRVSSLQAGLSDVKGEQVAYYDAGGSPYPGTLVAEGGGGPVPAAAPPVNPLDNPWGIYMSGLYTTGRLDGINGSAGFQPGYGFSSYGGMMGADYRFNDNFAAGFTSGYVAGLANLDGTGGQASSSSLLFGAYAAAWSGAFHGSFYFGASLDSFTTSRNLPDFGRTASASPSGNEYKFDASGGWDIKEGRALLSPYADLTHDHQHVDAFSEGGAGAMDLNVGPFGANSLRSTFGAKFSRKYTADWFAITPSLNVGWEHEFADQSRAIDAQFATGGGTFSVDTADVSRDALAAGVALTMDMTEFVSLRMGYSDDLRSDFSARTADFSLRVRF